jgi:hypothetical protein
MDPQELYVESARLLSDRRETVAQDIEFDDAVTYKHSQQNRKRGYFVTCLTAISYIANIVLFVTLIKALSWVPSNPYPVVECEHLNVVASFGYAVIVDDLKLLPSM